ncbi:MAG: carbamate kinase [bacterium]
MIAGVRPLLVVALGGNAVSPPASGLGMADERRAVAAICAELAALARGRRLLVVHGNGPQVGRLLGADDDLADLDVRVAQTQGELGYLLADGLEQATGEPACALVTRTRVDPADPALSRPDKPVGPVLKARPAAPAVRVPGGAGWRRVVPSPRPQAVLELDAIRRLLAFGHVIAGGGGGVPVSALGPVAAVIDKDHVAGALAIALDAGRLLFVTDVPGVYVDIEAPEPRVEPWIGHAEAQRRLALGRYAAGSMAPKVESAARFAAATGRTALIAAAGELAAAWRGRCGTSIG